jgi:hypothetical protein
MEVLLVFAAIALVVGVWLVASRMDRDRIEAYVTERGGRVVSVNWAPFGRGWFGEKNDRIYEVVYYDAQGRQHFATAKTSLWSGVYWTEDQVAHEKPSWYDRVPRTNEPGHPLVREIGHAQVAEPPPSGDASDEVERLRRENEELRARLGRARDA